MCFAIVEQLPYRDTVTGVKDDNLDYDNQTMKLSLEKCLEEATKDTRVVSGLLQSAQMLDK